MIMNDGLEVCKKEPDAQSSSSGHEVRPINDLFRPHQCISPVKVKVEVEGKVVLVL
jgi:hypothetical protein